MFKFLRKKIGIIGYGNMGAVIAERIRQQYSLTVFDKDKNKTKNLAGRQIANNTPDLVNRVDVVILAVKPQDLNAVLNEIKNDLKDKLVISIAAGIATSDIEKILGDTKVIRAMPNLPARIGEGMICFSKGKFAEQKDLNLSYRLFKKLGNRMTIDEGLMNDATAAAGSGPAFISERIISSDKKPEEIKKEFDRTVMDYLVSKRRWTKLAAMTVATTTSSGTLALIKVPGFDSVTLIKQVASKGGTTEAGLDKLHNNGTLEEAMDAAIKRAEELSKKE